MTSPCDLVEDFFDGEMTPAQAEDFRTHAATCATCQHELLALAKLHALETQYSPELKLLNVPGGAPTSPPLPRTRRLLWGSAAAGAAVALAAMLVFWISWSRRAGDVPEEIFHPAGNLRLADGRSADPRARAYRPKAQVDLGPRERGSLQHEALGKLERAGDHLGIAAAYLARGKASDAEEALAVLQGAEPTADILSEQAFAHLVRADRTLKDAEEALQLADQALALDPKHGPALWNRALALKALRLDALAAKAFEAVVETREPGWSDEALLRAKDIHGSVTRARDAWQETLKAGTELVATGAPPTQELRGMPVLRSYFYDAVRSRGSSAEVNLLRPLAQELDRLAGNTALSDYVSFVATRDFKERGPLAAEYKRLVLGGQPVSPELLRRFREAHQPDLLLGVLARLPDSRQSERRADELEELAREMERDAWLSTLALYLAADVHQKSGGAEGTTRAQAALEKALRLCEATGLDYRCADVELDLAYLFDHTSRFEQADAHAHQGWAAALRAQAWVTQGQLVLELAQQARHREDVSVARAFYEEALERSGGWLDQLRVIHEGLANVDVQLLQFDSARSHLNAALDTGQPLDLTGALALADIARVRPDPDRDPAAMGAFEKRLGTLEKKGEQVLAREALAQWELTRNGPRGQAMLRRVIEEAEAGGLATEDQSARRARAFSYTSLILDAGKRGDAGMALQLFEEEVGRNIGVRGLPEQCLLAVTADGERLLAVVRGAQEGPPTLTYDGNRSRPLPRNLYGLLPPAVVEQLSGCKQVAVLARAPVYGRPGILPATVAWSYRGVGSAQKPPVSGSRRHLVIQEVSLTSERLRRLPATERWSVKEVPGEALEQLSHDEATPPAVLRRMEDATDITFVAHALVRPESEEAYLVLAPGAGGDDALRASELQKAQLRGHPLVVLVSCQGARPAPILHEARSLPAAFLRAGARAVLAASDNVPEKDGPEFFAEVRAAILAGTSPAQALRAVRARWVDQGRGAPWLAGVLLFE